MTKFGAPDHSHVRVEAAVARALALRHGGAAAADMLGDLISGDHRAAETMFDILGSKVEIGGDLDDPAIVVVESVYELRASTAEGDGTLDDGVYWDNRGIVVRGGGMPESMALLAVGRPARDVVDHQHLEGLTITGVRQSDGALVLETEDCLMGIEQVRAL